MRVMIWADMEGVAGVTVWEHTGGSSPLYEEGRRLYTEEINAAVRGCKAAGATEIVVIDGHDGGYLTGKGFLSLIPERLESGAEYVLGHPWTRHTEPLERGCDAVLFVGAHSMAGTLNGLLSHTVSSEAWYVATINGRPVGESGRYSARHLPAVDARALIEAKSAEALRNRSRWPKPLTFTPPVTFQVELATPDRVETFRGRTGVEIVGPRTVRASGRNFWEAWDALWYRY